MASGNTTIKNGIPPDHEMMTSWSLAYKPKAWLYQDVVHTQPKVICSSWIDFICSQITNGLELSQSCNQKFLPMVWLLFISFYRHEVWLCFQIGIVGKLKFSDLTNKLSSLFNSKTIKYLYVRWVLHFLAARQ